MYFPSVFTTSLSSTPSVITLVVEYSVPTVDSCLFVDDASDVIPVASALSSKSPDAVFLIEASAFFATSYSFS